MKSKKNIKGIIILAILCMVSVLFINISLASNTATVSVETARLRETADTSGKVLDLLSMNDKVEVLEKTGDWYKVRAKGITGYLRNDLITVEEGNLVEETNTNNSEAEENVNITNEEVNDKEQNVEDTEEIEKGMQKIAKDTKLKIVPAINATDIVEVKKDEEVNVIEIINDWVCVETQNTKGWIRKENIQKEEPAKEVVAEVVEEVTIKKLYVNTESIFVREEPSRTSNKVTSLVINTLVDVVSEENGWSKVKVNGKEGYILSTLLSTRRQETSRSSTTRTQTNTQTSNTANTEIAQVASKNEETQAVAPAVIGAGATVVTTARGYIGSRYVYGGTTPSGFDCSGFTSYVFRLHGVNLNRTAAGQYSNGVAVSKANLQPGDLVMFGKSGISHVGIYIGGGNMVHAANSANGVRIDNINSGYYANQYVGARRVI